MTVSSVLIPCLNSFNDLVKNLKYESNRYGELAQVVPHSCWEDELGRLRVWTANIGAHQTGQSSLDFRLRDASHIRHQIVKLLEDLHKTIQDTDDFLEEDSGPEDRRSSNVPLDEESPSAEVQQLYEDTKTTISCLFQMSMLIRKPAHHDFLRTSSSEVSAFEPFDKDHVRNKHRSADEAIVARLGLAITRRRGYLKYRERHRAKLGKGIEGLQDSAMSELSETIATDLKTAVVDADADEEVGSTAGLSQTSYASSLLGDGAITVPSPPKESADRRPFECPYCFFVITIDGTRSWTRHVFKDIQPYVCISKDCVTPKRLYDSRRHWFNHTTTAHPQLLVLEASRPSAAIRENEVPRLLCTLCDTGLAISKQYERHVARHLEELALFVLPRNEGDEDEVKMDSEQMEDFTDDIEKSSSAGSMNRQLDEVRADSREKLEKWEREEENMRGRPKEKTKRRTREEEEMEWRREEETMRQRREEAMKRREFENNSREEERTRQRREEERTRREEERARWRREEETMRQRSILEKRDRLAYERIERKELEEENKRREEENMRLKQEIENVRSELEKRKKRIGVAESGGREGQTGAAETGGGEG